ncbi:MAG: thioredoxin domain-containing protein [Rhizobiaceae bacterium]|nr:thioredoxin domain-containing protein [Rhizobiaceae bacterium]
MTLTGSNLLAQEASPYLRQHAGNPVNWQPWSAAALAEARQRNCPVLLSVGYAACHWCHVMAHESFEDPEIGLLMNRLFVNIKVDREERPDIDQIYMAALTALGEQGGWPLTMFLTPAAEPIWGGTYFPPQPRHGRPSFRQVLEAVGRAWGNDRERLVEGSVKLQGFIAERLDRRQAGRQPQPDDLRNLAAAVNSSIDPERGGLRGAPKFPNAPFLAALWLDWLIERNATSRDNVLLTLRAMLDGGIYDHVGGGLARYSTDAEWLVPHFEKMLYDNAQLIRLCLWAFAETGDKLFRIRIEETIGWIASEMIVDGGGFASSLDADSEGEEGRFYTWTVDRISNVLGDGAPAFLQSYELVAPAGWEGDPILRVKSPAAPSDRHADALAALRADRARRPRPGRDDKVLADWNGLAIAAIAEAAAAFNRADWLALAAAAYHAVVSQAETDRRVPHVIHEGCTQSLAMSTDYAALINAAISLHAATGEGAYFGDAAVMARLLDQWHGAESGGGHYLTASDAADVPLRIRGDIDEAIPSATAQIIEALTRLATATSDPVLLEKAWQAASAATGRIAQQPYGQAGIIASCASLASAQKLLIVEDRDAPQLVTVANRYPDPRRVVVVSYLGDPRPGDLLPGGIVPDITFAAAYLCEGQTCRAPVSDPALLERMLTEGRPKQA